MQTVAEAVASDTGSEEREVKATALGSTISNGQTESQEEQQRRWEESQSVVGPPGRFTVSTE